MVRSSDETSQVKYPINAIDSFGSTALQIVALNGQPMIVKLLLTVEGIDLNLTDVDEWTSLCSAKLACQWETVRMLTEAGADTNFHTNWKNSALSQAVECGDAEIHRC